MITCDDHSYLLSCLADLVFPPACILCGQLCDGGKPSIFCDECLARITFIVPPLCRICGRPFTGNGGNGRLCGDCTLKAPVYSRARALGLYEGALLEAIHLFKYRGDIRAGELLGAYMAIRPYDFFSFLDYDAIIPIPLHRRRLKERGFNQSVILAGRIARLFSIPLDITTLRRTSDRPPQVGLGRSQRGANVRGAFEIKGEDKISGKRLLLVDDVLTTGSTVGECAGLLMHHGAEDVAVITLARA